jgi:tetratricopeptide (TPR) repeat protein
MASGRIRGEFVYLERRRKNMDANRTKQIGLWHKNGQHQKIADELNQLPLAERDYEAISWLGRAYNNLDRYEDALEQFRQIAETGQADPNWHFRVGYAYYHLDRLQEAVDAFRTVIKLDPDDRDAALRLSWILREMGQEEEADAVKAVADRPFPLDPDADATLTGIDLSSFWEDSDYALKEYVLAPPDDALIASVEEELGYKLPASYIEMMKLHNGGIPYNTSHPTSTPTSWAPDHVALSGIYGIGRDNNNSLCGHFGSPFMIEEWGYPDIGVVFCDCPSGGHDVLMLDYRSCGKDGEPQVIHVDQEGDYAITYVAPNFASFIRGLVNDEVYDTSAEDKEKDLQKVKHGEFSPLLADLCSRTDNPARTEAHIRAVCTHVIETKGFFSFHDDELSLLMYDVQFGLYTQAYPQTNREEFLTAYPQMIAFGGAFSQRGYGPSFVSDWLDRRIAEGRIIVKAGGAVAFTEEALAEVFRQLAQAAAEEDDAGGARRDPV